ncbi:hypothetical protein [Rugamonas rubra]|nr:hypothetical protein [Rugamonas rubra]
MMVLKTGAAIVAGLILAGCAARFSPVPQATNFPASQQVKLQAASHWGTIAGHIEKNMLAELKKNPPRPLFINEAPNPSPFQRALNTQLITSLVNDGYTVSKSAAGSLKIDLDVQAVTFSADRPQYRYHGEHGALAAGVFVLSEIEPPLLLAAAAGVGAQDAYSWFNDQFAPGATPRTELIITVSVSDQYRYFARNTSAYYVTDSDRVLYGIIDKEPELPQLSKTYQLRGER